MRASTVWQKFRCDENVVYNRVKNNKSMALFALLLGILYAMVHFFVVAKMNGFFYVSQSTSCVPAKVPVQTNTKLTVEL